MQTLDEKDKRLVNLPRHIPENYWEWQIICPGNPSKPSSCWFTKHKRVHKEHTSLYVSHRHSLGDHFGATLESRPDGKLYFQHFLCNIKPGSPADRMKFQEKDEIIIFHDKTTSDSKYDVFAPEQNHAKIVELFRKIKVDGKTRFSLVVRRKTGRKGDWDWLKISALLCPDVQHRFYHDPTIQDVRSDIIQRKCHCLLEVSDNNIQKFVDIRRSGINFSVPKYDKKASVVAITEKSTINPDTGKLDKILASICSIDETDYVNISPTGDVVIQPNPVWFQCEKAGSDICFIYQDKFLAFDHNAHTVTLNDKPFYFQEIPITSLKTRKSLSRSSTSESDTSN